IVLAAVVFRRFYPGDRSARVWGWIAIALIVALSLIRFSWAMLLVPMFVVEFGGTRLSTRVLAVALALVVDAILVWTWGWLAAPGHNAIFDVFQAFQSSPLAAVGAVLAGLRITLGNYMVRPALDALVRLQIVVMAVGIPVAYIIGRRRGLPAINDFFPEG